MLQNSGINKVFLVGHVGREPQIRRSEDGQEMLCFPLVTNEVLKKAGQSVEHLEWHQIKVPLDVAKDENLAKGQLIYLEGKIHTRSFTDDIGVKRYKSCVIACRITVLSGAKMPEGVDMLESNPVFMEAD